jgi:hypothetical protein
MIEGKVKGEESGGWVGLDFGVGFQYNTGWFEGGEVPQGVGKTHSTSDPIKYHELHYYGTKK